MRLTHLHKILGELIEQGHGAARVIDDNGNSVADVSPPERPNADDGDDTSAVMVHLRVEYGDRR